MAKGGKREGAGRKPGSSTKRSQEAMAKADELGVDPVEMLLEITKWAYEQFTAADGRTKENADTLRDYAKECAPYVRPKLSSIEASGPDGGPISVGVIRFGDLPENTASE